MKFRSFYKGSLSPSSDYSLSSLFYCCCWRWLWVPKRLPAFCPENKPLLWPENKLFPLAWQKNELPCPPNKPVEALFENDSENSLLEVFAKGLPNRLGTLVFVPENKLRVSLLEVNKFEGPLDKPEAGGLVWELLWELGPKLWINEGVVFVVARIGLLVTAGPEAGVAFTVAPKNGNIYIAFPPGLYGLRNFDYEGLYDW